MYLFYLFNNRKKSPLFSKAQVKRVAKRLIHAYALIRLEFNRQKLVRAGSKVGNLTLVANQCRLNGKRANLHLGDHVFIGDATLNLHGQLHVGNHSVINDGVTIITASHDIDDENWTQFSKNTQIGKYVWIATGATILPGVTIADYAVIGAGAVVTRSVNEGEVVAGNPAKVLRHRKRADFKYSPVQFVAPFDAWLN